MEGHLSPMERQKIEALQTRFYVVSQRVSYVRNLLTVLITTIQQQGNIPLVAALAGELGDALHALRQDTWDCIHVLECKSHFISSVPQNGIRLVS